MLHQDHHPSPPPFHPRPLPPHPASKPALAPSPRPRPSPRVQKSLSAPFVCGMLTRTLLVKLLSTAGTGFFYTTKRPRVALYKLAFRKFDPIGPSGALAAPIESPCADARVHVCPPPAHSAAARPVQGGQDQIGRPPLGPPAFRVRAAPPFCTAARPCIEDRRDLLLPVFLQDRGWSAGVAPCRLALRTLRWRRRGPFPPWRSCASSARSATGACRCCSTIR